MLEPYIFYNKYDIPLKLEHIQGHQTNIQHRQNVLGQFWPVCLGMGDLNLVEVDDTSLICKLSAVVDGISVLLQQCRLCLSLGRSLSLPGRHPLLRHLENIPIDTYGEKKSKVKDSKSIYHLPRTEKNKFSAWQNRNFKFFFSYSS